MNWVSDALSIVAVGISIAVAIDNHRSNKRGNEAAEVSAESSVEQVELSRPPDVAFKIRRVGGAQYALVNVGTARATSVWMESHPAVQNGPTGQDLEPGRPFQFLIAGGFDTTTPPSLAVRCNELDAEVWVEIE